MTYKEQIKHPKWQKKRLEILERDKYTCQCCSNKEITLHVHHLLYLKNKMIWEYENNLLTSLCENCHSEWHKYNNEIKIMISKYIFPEQLKQILDLIESLKGFNNIEVRCIINIIGNIKNIKYLTHG